MAKCTKITHRHILISWTMIPIQKAMKIFFRPMRIFPVRKNDTRKFSEKGKTYVYLLSVIDAYVDAELSDFDISKDLGLKIEPVIFNDGRNKIGGNAIGLQCSLKF